MPQLNMVFGVITYQDYTINVKLKQKPGGALPLKPRNAAYHSLMEKLWVAQDIFKNEGDGGRKGSQEACLTMIDFLRFRWINPELGAPFSAMAMAFADLKSGLQPALFSHNTPATKRPRSSESKHLRYLAGVLMDVYMELGETQSAAASKIARGVKTWPTMSGATAGTIRRWRVDLLALDAKKRRQYDNIREHILVSGRPRATIIQLLKEPPGAAKTRK